MGLLYTNDIFSFKNFELRSSFFGVYEPMYINRQDLKWHIKIINVLRKSRDRAKSTTKEGASVYLWKVTLVWNQECCCLLHWCSLMIFPFFSSLPCATLWLGKMGLFLWWFSSVPSDVSGACTSWLGGGGSYQGEGSPRRTPVSKGTTLGHLLLGRDQESSKGGSLRSERPGEEGHETGAWAQEGGPDGMVSPGCKWNLLPCAPFHNMP